MFSKYSFAFAKYQNYRCLFKSGTNIFSGRVLLIATHLSACIMGFHQQHRQASISHLWKVPTYRLC